MAALTSLTVGLSSSLGSMELRTVVLRGRIIDTEGVDSVLISVVRTSITSSAILTSWSDNVAILLFLRAFSVSAEYTVLVVQCTSQAYHN